MKKAIAKIVGLATLAIPTTSLAANLAPGAYPDRISGREDVESFVSDIINWFLGFIGLIAVIMFIYGGILYLTAGGNDENTGKAKKAMLYAIVGIIIVLLAYTIVAAVTNALGAVA
ncbi:MAG: pilin [Candidatus Gracilibacteria bacterium]|nr:pilin [Candidatus Gracilibacteria bacterium]